MRIIRPTHVYIKRVVAVKSPHKLNGLMKKLAVAHLGKSCAIKDLLNVQRDEGALDVCKGALLDLSLYTDTQVAHATSFFVHLVTCGLWRSHPHVHRLLSISMSQSGSNINQRLILEAMKACNVVLSTKGLPGSGTLETIGEYIETMLERVESPCADFAEVLYSLKVKNARFTDLLVRELKESAVYMDNSRLVGILGYLLHADCHPREPIYDAINILSECKDWNILLRVIDLLWTFKVDHVGFIEHVVNMCIDEDGSGSPMDYLDTRDICMIFDVMGALGYAQGKLANAFFSRYGHESWKNDSACKIYRSTKYCTSLDLLALLQALGESDSTLVNLDAWRNTLLVNLTLRLKRIERHGKRYDASVFTRLFSLLSRMEPRHIPRNEAVHWAESAPSTLHSLDASLSLVNGYIMCHYFESQSIKPIFQHIHSLCKYAAQLPGLVSYIIHSSKRGSKNNVHRIIQAAQDRTEEFVYDTSVRSNYKLMKKSGMVKEKTVKCSIDPLETPLVYPQTVLPDSAQFGNLMERKFINSTKRPSLQECLYTLRSLYRTLHIYASLHGINNLPFETLGAIQDFLKAYDTAIDLLDSKFEAEYKFEPAKNTRKREYSKIRLNWDHFVEDYQEAIRISQEPKYRKTNLVMPDNAVYKQSLQLFNDAMGRISGGNTGVRKTPKSSDMHIQVASSLKACTDHDLYFEEPVGPYFVDILMRVGQ
ncbi:hypothetical protein BEWA_026420 [Theileria equi strain WA]|uniref:Uncharacterized protein n=1 Tax=Theileria equi strain WA TaxID=1537102 RepID=L0AX11_THEEQ|nr:hypothetical protein BEWA_026420 [Theileria equi strain WA]AFZ79793.1 hypothetical protein BEWA_026420 [Theileria equi strain WA]|eukprot:XP_004829459.1 hypothetical protein BEWA_026420 [Theileria equi strain WA]